jgi:hypothetical protein
MQMVVSSGAFSGYTSAMFDSLPFRRPVLAVFGIIILLLVLQALFPRQAKPVDLNEMAEEDCVGDPLPIPYEYTGNVVDPWSCQVQCTDQKRRYLVYTNGVATQCEELPGCNDWGEDRGQTCRIPGEADVSASGSFMTTIGSQANS